MFIVFFFLVGKQHDHFAVVFVTSFLKLLLWICVMWKKVRGGPGRWVEVGGTGGGKPARRSEPGPPQAARVITKWSRALPGKGQL